MHMKNKKKGEALSGQADDDAPGFENDEDN